MLSDGSVARRVSPGEPAFDYAAVKKQLLHPPGWIPAVWLSWGGSRDRV